MQYKVLKKFSTDRPLEIGEIVELDGRNVDKLVELRYLAPLGVVVPKLESEKVKVPSVEPVPVAAELSSTTKRGRGRPKKVDAERARVVTLPTTTSD